MFTKTNEVTDWRELQMRVAQLFEEMEYDVKIEHAIELGSRGRKEIDVVTVDRNASVNQTYLIECKYWNAPIHQGIVHELRSVMQDSGANTGFVISKHGFQAGAYKAVQYTNIHLLDFEELQHKFGDQWFRTQRRKIEGLAALIERIQRTDFRNGTTDDVLNVYAQYALLHDARYLAMFYWWSRHLLRAYFVEPPADYRHTEPFKVTGYLNDPEKYLPYIEEDGRVSWPPDLTCAGPIKPPLMPTTTYTTVREFFRDLNDGMRCFLIEYDSFIHKSVGALRTLSWQERQVRSARSARARAEEDPIKYLRMVLDKEKYEDLLCRYIELR
jgi:hypothetical protein